MDLVMFDVDGTLTQSNEVDAECFISAMRKAFNINHIDPDWSKYKFVTDSGIFSEIFELHFQRKPGLKDLDLIKRYFLQNLQAAIFKSKSCCTEISGAVSAFNRLKKDKNYALSFATGCWLESAELKLKCAGFNFFEIPFASAADSMEREKIMRISLNRAKIKYDVQNFNSVTYVGDGVWDVVASKNLVFNFIGISADSNKQKLVDAGAKFVISDFKNFDRFTEILKSFSSHDAI
jgi:phosphoglycolate phosphatase-like HAD superfamily hydrolase